MIYSPSILIPSFGTIVAVGSWQQSCLKLFFFTARPRQREALEILAFFTSFLF